MVLLPAGAKAGGQAGTPPPAGAVPPVTNLSSSTHQSRPPSIIKPHLPHRPFPQRLAIRSITTVAIMAARGVSLLKFVGTVSLGLLTVCFFFWRPLLVSSRYFPRGFYT